VKYTLANARWTIDDTAGELVVDFMQGPAPDEPDPMGFAATETYTVRVPYADLQVIPIEPPALEGVSPTNGD
jgi:hypothetical protein